MSHQNEIACAVMRTLEQYLKDLDGETPAALHALVIRSAERPMLEFVLQRTEGNHWPRRCSASTATPCAAN